MQLINPIDHPHWDDLLLTHPDSCFFHTSAWARVLSESYGYKPVYFTEIENGNLSALVAIMEVNSFLTGKRGVSLPFSDECPILLSDDSQGERIIKEIITYGKRGG